MGRRYIVLGVYISVRVRELGEGTSNSSCPLTKTPCQSLVSDFFLGMHINRQERSHYRIHIHTNQRETDTLRYTHSLYVPLLLLRSPAIRWFLWVYRILYILWDRLSLSHFVLWSLIHDYILLLSNRKTYMKGDWGTERRFDVHVYWWWCSQFMSKIPSVSFQRISLSRSLWLTM